MLAWLIGDRRLIGRWRSDRELTMAEWPFPPEATAEQRETVSRIFGKLELTYGRWRCRSTFDGEASVGRYRVLAKDASSVMVVSRRNGPVLGRERTLFHIHFAEDHYWITLGNSNRREFFRRIE
jgi:hypothetical protein